MPMLPYLAIYSKNGVEKLHSMSLDAKISIYLLCSNYPTSPRRITHFLASWSLASLPDRGNISRKSELLYAQSIEGWETNPKFPKWITGNNVNTLIYWLLDPYILSIGTKNQMIIQIMVFVNPEGMMSHVLKDNPVIIRSVFSGYCYKITKTHIMCPLHHLI